MMQIWIPFLWLHSARKWLKKRETQWQSSWLDSSICSGSQSLAFLSQLDGPCSFTHDASSEKRNGLKHFGLAAVMQQLLTSTNSILDGEWELCAISFTFGLAQHTFSPTLQCLTPTCPPLLRMLTSTGSLMLPTTQ